MMKEDTDIPLFRSELEDGQYHFAGLIRTLLSDNAPQLLTLVDANEQALLEPLVFAYFHNDPGKISLLQLLWGYLSPEKRPGEITVYANGEGVVELPNAGYLITTRQEQLLRLVFCGGGLSDISLFDEAGEVPYRFSPYITIPGTDIKVSSFRNKLLDPFFVDEMGKPVPVEWEDPSAVKLQQLERAFAAIRRFLPEYFELITAVTKRIVIYKGALPYSFASVGAHGIAFLQIPEDCSEVFFSEDIIHQCGHMIFSAIAAGRGFFSVHNDTLLKVINKDENDPRTIFVALHGLYTEAWMSRFLELCLEERHFFREDARMEIIGRFALIYIRFGLDLRHVCEADIFNEQGQLLVGTFLNLYTDILRRRISLLSRVDISNQPYCFCRKVFFETNRNRLLNDQLMHDQLDLL